MYTQTNHIETLLHTPDEPWLGSLREEYDTIESTQQRAVSLLRDGLIGAVVSAKQQTAGLGRMGRTFWSPDADGLYVSLTLPNPDPIERFSLLSLWAGITVVRAVREAGILLSPVPINLTRRLALKWPNDVLLDGKKVAGILVNSVIVGSQPAGAVLGIGLNLNFDLEKFPKELQNTATSIKHATSYEWDRLLFLTHLLSVIERMWHRLQEPPESILSEWLRWGTPIGQNISLRDGQELHHGKFAGLLQNGELVLEMTDNKKRAFLSGLIEPYPVD